MLTMASRGFRSLLLYLIGTLLVAGAGLAA
jgi:hypothetical protein